MDFVATVSLLFGAAFALEFALRGLTKNSARIIVLFVLLAILLLIWAELAVGILGTPLAGS